MKGKMIVKRNNQGSGVDIACGADRLHTVCRRIAGSALEFLEDRLAESCPDVVGLRKQKVASAVVCLDGVDVEMQADWVRDLFVVSGRMRLRNGSWRRVSSEDCWIDPVPEAVLVAVCLVCDQLLRMDLGDLADLIRSWEGLRRNGKQKAKTNGKKGSGKRS